MHLRAPSRRHVLAGAAGLLAVTAAAPALAASRLEKSLAPKPKLDERWSKHDPNSTATVDHSAWDALLGRYVRVAAKGPNLFAYGEVTAEDKEALSAYLELLSNTPVSTLNRTEQFAFWANLYNALTIEVVLDAYPVDSIRSIDISPGLFADGPWGANVVAVEGQDLSLNTIEHNILRPLFNDPRVHYSVNCASIGCPNLQPKAFAGATLEAQLDEAARQFVNDARGLGVQGGKLVASSIYLWFQVDFGDNDAAVLDHARKFASAETLAMLEGRTAIDDFAYDWNLNDAKGRAS